MTTTTTTLNLSNIKQLVDLNGDKVNFELNFKVESTDGSDFDALVVTQEILDSGSEINYQKANGTISGTIISDKGEYQSYLLLLKSDTPTEVIVNTIMKDIPLQPNQNPESYQPQQHQQPQRPQSQRQPAPYQQHPAPYQQQPKKKKSGVNWVNVILIILAVLMLGFVGWMFYRYFTKEKTLEPSPTQQSLPQPQQVIVTPPEIDTDSIVKKVSNSLETIVDSKLNSTAENITKNVTNELNQKIDGRMNSLNEGIQSTIHKEISNTNIQDKLSSTINEGFNSLHKSLEGIDKKSEDIASNIASTTNTFLDTSKTLVSEAITKTLDSSKQTVDLGSIESKLNDIKTSIDSSSQIKNPLMKKSGDKKDGLIKSIESLKIQKDK